MRAFDAGSVAIVLVSGYQMVPRGRPHWIFAFGRDGRHVLMHDPAAVRDDQGMAHAPETYAVPWTAFERMTQVKAHGAAIGSARRSSSGKGKQMTGWVILVDQPKDFPNADTPHKVITTREYLARPRLFEMGRPKLLNLSRSYALPVEGLLRLAAGGGARPPRGADGRDHAGAARVQALRARAARARGRAQPLRPARRFPARGRDSSCWSASASRATRGSSSSAGCCSTGSAARRSRSRSSPASGCRSTASGRATSTGWRTARASSSASRCTITPSANGATRRPARSPSTIWRCCTTRTRRCRRRRRRRSSTWRASPRSCRSTSSRSPSGSSPNSPSTTACSSARPPRSTTTPTGSRAAPGRRACRSSTIRSR